MGDLSHQLGFVAETTYGTPVAVNRGVEFVTESLRARPVYHQSEGIRPGRRYGAGRYQTRQDAGGTVKTEIPTTGMGLWFHHLLGAVTTTNPEAGVYTHTYRPGALSGKSMTLQKGVEDSGGTVRPFTYEGVKILGANFSVGRDGVLMCDWEFDARRERKDIALASLTIDVPNLYRFEQGVVKKDGVTLASVLSVGSAFIRNSLAANRYHMGSAGLKAEPKNTPSDQIGGSLVCEFQNLTDFYDAWRDETPVEIVLEFTTDVDLGTSDFEIFRLTYEACRFDGDTPQVSNKELVEVTVPFIGYDPDSGDAVTIFNQTSDATP